MSQHKRAWSALLTAGAILLSTACGAQDAPRYPTRPVSLIVAFPPGGGADVIARIIAKGMESVAGHPFLVINRTGATGAIAAEAVKRAEPDGYTLLVGAGATMSAFWALKTNPSFDTLRDFVPITLIGTTPYLLLVNPSVPAKTIPELIAYMKQNPDKLNFGSSGIGGASHLFAEMFKQASGTQMQHVPYQGTGQATNAAISGDVQVTFDQVSAKQFVESGRLRALGISSLTRSPFAPEIPPIADTLPGFEGMSWLGLFAPANTPQRVTEQLRDYWDKASKLPDVKKALDTASNTSTTISTEEFISLLKSERDKWREVGKKAGIVLE